MLCANHGSTLCATQNQAQQTDEEGHNHRDGLRSVVKGDVKDTYLGLGIRHCSPWGLGCLELIM